eukprot:CAMPEP_0185723996 /NCGR_PEP_ID=MMETSP1171-20130828/631_1 /TAXON_ID=374046 /ORGANISM="Helicotheca tamensis, Strain CCMP826" /LENGTH=349 /DNA_ID=CAMNT_0028391767 /DNA_START=29 /DNA_END=1078 /DNA_ORIENTATION=+
MSKRQHNPDGEVLTVEQKRARKRVVDEYAYKLLELQMEGEERSQTYGHAKELVQEAQAVYPWITRVGLYNRIAYIKRQGLSLEDARDILVPDAVSQITNNAIKQYSSESSTTETPLQERRARLLMSTSVRTLKTAIFYGSAKAVTPPWGGDTRIGDRVYNWVKNTLSVREAQLGIETIIHDVTIFDPLVIFGKDGALSSFSGAEMRSPTFMMREMPPKAQELATKIAEADCYVIVSPEYNHVVPPALASLMGHFGGSLYKCKPSGIVTYSIGPWGGMRAAMSISTMCHELGCLPVSAMCGIPTVADILQPDGTPVNTNNRMLKQLPNMLEQLEWMAVAMKKQRDAVGTF